MSVFNFTHIIKSNIDELESEVSTMTLKQLKHSQDTGLRRYDNNQDLNSQETHCSTWSTMENCLGLQTIKLFTNAYYVQSESEYGTKSSTIFNKNIIMGVHW